MIQSKMVFSIDLKIIKIDLDHLSKLEIIKSRIICPEGKDHDFSKMHLFFGLEKVIIFLEFVIIRSLDEITFFEKFETWVILVIIRDLQNHRYHI